MAAPNVKVGRWPEPYSNHKQMIKPWPVVNSARHRLTLDIGFMKKRLIGLSVLGLASVVLAGSEPSLAAVSDWADGGKARARLVAAGVNDAGRIEGGIEIELPPGWKTYWRSPGAAGIPPRFNFSGSANLRDVEVSFPVPHRYDDGYAISNVYDGTVLLPFSGFVADPSAAVDVVLSMDIGVCEVVCIPEHLTLDLSVPGGVTDKPVDIALSAAREALPGPPEQGVLAAETARRSGGTDKRPVYEFALVHPQSAEIDVYVEGPADWYAGIPELSGVDAGLSVYEVAFDRLGSKTPIAEAAFVVTIVVPEKAIEQAIRPE